MVNKIGIGRIGLVLFTILTFFMATTVLAVEYNISQGLDYSGPYATVMKPLDDGSKIIFDWWNETVGERLGINVNRKTYDTRYDAAVVATLWPGILSGDKPVAHLGVGAPDFVPLMNRLPNDKVIVITSAPSYGFLWVPNQWVFQWRPTYMHEMAGLLNWLRMTKIKDRPIKIATFSNKKVTFYVDLVESLKEFAKQTPWIDLVDVEWVDIKPVSLISEMKRMASKKPDFIIIQTNTYQAVAAKRAQKALGIKIPILLTTHNGLQMCAQASGDLSLFEGDFEASSCNPDPTMITPAAKIYEEYKGRLGVKNSWSTVMAQGEGMAIFALRLVERAAEMVDKDNITGEAVYNALFIRPFSAKEMLGLTPEISFSKAYSFPVIKDLKVKIATVKDGKFVLATENWIPVPPVPKWGSEKK